MKKAIILISTLLITITSAYSQSSNYLNFGGWGDHIVGNLPDAFDDIENNSFTIELWIRPQDTGASALIFQAKKDNNNFVRITTYYRKISYYVEYNGIGNHSGSAPFGSYGNLWPDQWHHIACTWDATTKQVHIYINGELLTYDYNSFDAAGGTSVPNDTFSIGAVTWQLKGDIDEFAIWNEERTLTDILNSMNNEILLTEQNLAAYYKFNQGVAGQDNSSETVLVDSMNLYPGNLIGFTLSGNSSNWLSYNPLGISNFNTINNIYIYPNPSKEYIQITGLNGDEEIQIFNIQGVKVINYRILNNAKINIQDLSKGMYFIKFKNGKTKKFIKI